MKNKVEIVKEVTRRLFTSIAILICLSIGFFVALSMAKIPISVVAVVMVFGICGGFISVQRRLKSFNDEDLELLASSWPYVFLAPLTGGVLAVVIYLLFISGLLTGALFPTFDPPETGKGFTRLLETVAHGPSDYAKVMFWAFVAGFSESFVTDIIGNFTKSTNKRNQS